MHNPSATTVTQVLALALVISAACPTCKAINVEDTSVGNLAAHDGMYLFNGALRKMVPPGAANGSPQQVAASAVPCNCSDAAPRNESLLYGIDCLHQSMFNACDATFMKSYLQELNYNDGFCQMSCNRCPCCTSPSAVISKMGATRFLQAAAAVQPPLNTALSYNGFMATILVPTDAAWEAALKAYPSMMQNPELLLEILKFHIVPVEPMRRGLWTTPFMSVGATLFTSADGPATLQVKKFPMPSNTTFNGGLTGFQIYGPYNNATVLTSDVASCKSYITVIDTVLMPFNPSNLTSTGNGGLVGAAVGAPACAIQGNTAINGTVLKDGASNRQKTVGDCCASCQKLSGCNAFRYCAMRGGCTTFDGTSYPFGWCMLQSSPEVAAGQPPAPYDSMFDMPFVSGYLPKSSNVSAASAGRRLRAMA